MNDKPFTLPHYIGEKDNGEAVYEDISYQQLVRISYTFQNEPGYSKTIYSSNFAVTGDTGESALRDPDVEIESKTNSFVVALRDHNDSISIAFTYDTWQFRHTAIIEASLSGKAPASAVATKATTAKPTKPKTTVQTTTRQTAQEYRPSAQAPRSTRPQPTVPAAPEPEVTQAPTPTPQQANSTISFGMLMLVIILLIAVIILLCVLIVVIHNK